MRKKHYKTLKLHSIYSTALSIIFLIVILRFPDITLGVAMAFLIFYITGNGIIHSRNNKLERDTLIEYILISIIALVIIASIVLK